MYLKCTNLFVLSFSIGSLLDFLKSDEGGKVLLPKLIDFSAQVTYAKSPVCTCICKDFPVSNS